MRLCLAGIVILSLLSNASVLSAQRRAAARAAVYQSADVDASGALRIVTSDGRVTVVAKQKEQSSFQQPAISADRTAVGAQANYPNCCTSYDIPLELVVYYQGRVHRFKGNGLPIFLWHFADGGSRVAYGQEPVHFGCETHYELRDVASERLIDSVDVPQPCGLRPDPPETTPPTWVQQLAAHR
jgi:hypothetical protein